MNAVFKPVICVSIHILKTPYSVFSNGAFNDADIANPNTILVSVGSIIPSSHNLAVP